MVDQVVVPEPEAADPVAARVMVHVPPAEIRAMAFVASLGPTAPPARFLSSADEVDLAGEEALLDYLAKIRSSSAA
jgi:hypothetical protein